MHWNTNFSKNVELKWRCIWRLLEDLNIGDAKLSDLWYVMHCAIRYHLHKKAPMEEYYF